VSDLVHLMHHVIGHACLGQEHVELSRHAAGHRVHTELHLDAVLVPTRTGTRAKLPLLSVCLYIRESICMRVGRLTGE
jgi:hypothetical protein